MFGFLAPTRPEMTGPLTNLVAAESFWRMLPHDDPIAVQIAVCETLAHPMTRGGPSLDRVRALLALDERARALVDALVFGNLAGAPGSSSFEMQSWQAAFEICRSFGRVHTQFLGSVCESPRFQDWREYLPRILLCLLLHRQIELLLRPFVDERSTRFPWKGLAEVFRFMQSSGLLHDSLSVKRRRNANVLDTTLEREYIHVLLQDLMNGGHFPPHDALWISQCIPRWSVALALEPNQGRSAKSRFVVDPDGESGLVRPNPDSPESGLGLDTTSLLVSIRDEIVSLRDVPGRPSDGSSLSPGRQLKLLSKCSDLCSPERQVIARRGEREPAALTVEVVVGLPQILRTLRNKPQAAVAAAPRPVTTSEGMTKTDYGGFTADSTIGRFGGENTIAQLSIPGEIVAHPPLTMVDDSDSGCRLHGPALAASPIIPGSLIAFRAGIEEPWTLAVVRRVKKRMAGKRVEIGAEYLGADPRWVVVVVPDSDAGAARPPGSAPSRFAALYLPPSAVKPVLPMKTLVLPARGLGPEDRLSVRSRTSVHTIQLKEPLEEQAEFIWSPFEILERWLKDEPASRQPG